MSRKIAGLVPFGLGQTKPHHFGSMARIIWDNRVNLPFAWKVLNQGTCDGCALGTIGMKDWTLPEGDTHLCMVRLELLRLNTANAIPNFETLLADVKNLESMSSKQMRDLGRLPYPMRRRKGEAGFTRLSWEELFAECGERIKNLDNPDRFALYLTSRGVTNETYYVGQKYARIVGTNNVDNSARLCHSPSTAGLKDTLGVAATTCSYKDWFDSDLIIFVGSNPANDQPVSIKYLIEAKARGAKVVSINTFKEPGMAKYWVPSNTKSALFGDEVSNRFFMVHTGGDLAFFNAAQKVLLERGEHNKTFVDEHVKGLEALQADLQEQDLDRLIELAGTTREDLDAFVDMVVAASKGVIVWSMGVTQHHHGADTVRALCNLGLLKGWVGKTGCGMMPIRGHSGVQGGAEMGAYATAFPGGRPINDEVAGEFSKLWAFDVPAGKGLDTNQMLRAALEEKLDFFHIVGGNFLETMPQPAKIKEALEKVPVRLHQDIVLTTQMLLEPKDVVYLLPARTRYEQRGGGTETTTERRVILSPEIKGHDVGEALTEWEIFIKLAQAAKPELASKIDFQSGEEIRAEIAASIPAYKQIADLKEAGDNFQWGGAHLAPDGNFPTPDGKATLRPVRPPEHDREENQFKLSTRRGKQFNSMIQGDSDPLTGAKRNDLFFAQIDVERLGLAEGDIVELESPHGSYTGRVSIRHIRPGNLQGHWPEVNVLLPPDRVDPFGGVPDYNAWVTVKNARTKS